MMSFSGLDDMASAPVSIVARSAIAVLVVVAALSACSSSNKAGIAHREPAAYPSSPDITLVVIPRMAHMHNFADTRTRLWERFNAWLPAVTQDLPGRVRPRS